MTSIRRRSQRSACLRQGGAGREFDTVIGTVAARNLDHARRERRHLVRTDGSVV